MFSNECFCLCGLVTLPFFVYITAKEVRDIVSLASQVFQGELVLSLPVESPRAVARNFYWGGSACERSKAPRCAARGRGPPIFCEIWGPRAILAIEHTNKYVAIHMQLMYNFAEIYEN